MEKNEAKQMITFMIILAFGLLELFFWYTNIMHEEIKILLMAAIAVVTLRFLVFKIWCPEQKKSIVDHDIIHAEGFTKINL